MWLNAYCFQSALEICRAIGEPQILRFSTPRTKTRLWGPRLAQDDVVSLVIDIDD